MNIVAALDSECQLGSVLQRAGVTLGDGEFNFQFFCICQGGNVGVGRCIGAYTYLTQTDYSIKRGFEFGLVQFGLTLLYISLELVEVGFGLLVGLLTYSLLLVEGFLAGQTVLG